MDIKEFHTKLKDIHKRYDTAVLNKIAKEREFAQVKMDFTQKIMEHTFETKKLRLEKADLVATYNSQKKSPEEVKRLRNQFTRKKENLMKDKQRKCNFCPETEDLTAHHIISLVDGGTNESSNLVWACRECHDIEEGRE